MSKEPNELLDEKEDEYFYLNLYNEQLLDEFKKFLGATPSREDEAMEVIPDNCWDNEQIIWNYKKEKQNEEV